MKIVHTKTSRRDFESLPKEIQKIAEKKLELFGDNPHHPSLHVKKMEGLKNIWEGRITGKYRFTFKIEGDVYILRRMGTHDILKQESE